MGKQNQPHANNLCGAKTRAGTPCKNRAMPNGKCRMHGGKSTGPKDITKLKKNKNSEKHGFFSKYLPKETLDLVQEINLKKTIDILWENIQIQYAAIIRSQKIMYVEDIYDMTKELKKDKTVTGDMSSMHEEEYEIQFAWDKQATFLKAQSRAMTTLQGMIKRYEEMLQSDLVTEEQKLRIEKLKKELKTDTKTEDKLKDYFEKLGAEIDGSN